MLTIVYLLLLSLCVIASFLLLAGTLFSGFIAWLKRIDRPLDDLFDRLQARRGEKPAHP